MKRSALWIGIAAALGVAGWGVFSARSLQAPSQPSALAPVAARPPALPPAVTALGRLEPKDGLIRLAGPSAPSVVIAKLLVEEGDRVQAGQVLAQLDTFAVRGAAVDGAEAELANAQAELRRYLDMHRERVISQSLREKWELRVKVAQADLNRARAELERTRVRAPLDGTVIRIHAREGERVGSDGILEVGRTDQMFAIAEVYETDIPGIRIGQRAKVMSPVFEAPLAGEVERIRLKVGKMDVLGADPAAKIDARVVEVEVRLAESTGVAGLTNLQVEVEFER